MNGFQVISERLKKIFCSESKEFLCSIILEPINIEVALFCLIIPGIIVLVFRKSLTVPIVQTIPGYCTAIGIIYTFTIIYQTLGINDDLFKVDDDNTSLKMVVKTLSYKFSCSLIGVFFSIVWNLSIKGVISYRENQASRIEAWLQRDPQEILWSLEQNLITMLQEYRENAEKVSKAALLTAEQSKSLLERMLAVVETFDESARKDLRKTLDNLKDALTNSMATLGQDALKTSQKHIEKTNEEFLTKAKDILATNQGEFGKILGASAAALEETLKKLNEIGGGIHSELEETRKGAKQGSEVVADGFNAGAESIKNGFTEFTESMTQKFDHLNTEFEGFAQQIQGQTQKILDDNLEKVEKAFSRLEEIQANSINRLEESTKQFNQSVHSYGTLQDHQYDVLRHVQDQIVLLKQLQENAELQLKEWGEQVDEMEAVRNRVADIANTIDELQDIKESLAALTTRN